jgi:hypothetical protein
MHRAQTRVANPPRSFFRSQTLRNENVALTLGVDDCRIAVFCLLLGVASLKSATLKYHYISLIEKYRIN